MITSGLRVFDIRDPEKPKEIAYFVAPPSTISSTGGPVIDERANYAMSSPVFAPEPEHAGQLVGQRAAHLHGRAFAADRGAEQVRGDGADQHQRRHAQRDDALGVVDLVDQEVVAGFDRAAEAQVQPADRGARQR